ncbi:hypothetical protein LX32DRAFT_269726 [Colletotrichum zoysiae]|uniref:Uncharacterized protein n=1 Tax=Colletotrichum zoysiae TaxID=1216348 RepID=A0AAD9H4J7_9PEZI|nr:hypothetical protein LX32DRAFT_269726 [Colletotrichum zoysiae]
MTFNQCSQSIHFSLLCRLLLSLFFNLPRPTPPNWLFRRPSPSVIRREEENFLASHLPPPTPRIQGLRTNSARPAHKQRDPPSSSHRLDDMNNKKWPVGPMARRLTTIHSPLGVSCNQEILGSTPRLVKSFCLTQAHPQTNRRNSLIGGRRGEARRGLFSSHSFIYFVLFF